MFGLTKQQMSKLVGYGMMATAPLGKVPQGYR